MFNRNYLMISQKQNLERNLPEARHNANCETHIE